VRAPKDRRKAHLIAAEFFGKRRTKLRRRREKPEARCAPCKSATAGSGDVPRETIRLSTHLRSSCLDERAEVKIVSTVLDLLESVAAK
jgi:hypothetical protein